MPIQEQYNSAKEALISSLRVLDTYVDGLHKPQLLQSFNDWTPLKSSKGVYLKNLSLFKPDRFAIALVHGTKGAAEEKHILTDTLEIHVISGKVLFNGLEFRAGDRLTIPAREIYSFNFIEDSYLTAKFIPKIENDLSNFNKWTV